MSGLWTIFRRELSAYFNSAIAYIFLIVFVLFTNGFFMLQFFQSGSADMRPFFNALPFVLNIFIPAISMRLWAEDKSGHTFELLLTFPLKPWQLVLGKYLASLVFYMGALVCTFTLPMMMTWVGKPDLGPIAGGYLGVFLMGALFLAIGIFISGLCKDQIVAFVLTVLTAFSVFFMGGDLFAQTVDGWLPGAGSFLKNNLGLLGHISGFSKGVVDVKDILYFALLGGTLLFLNGLSLEGRYRPKAKWVFSGAVAVSLVSVVLLHWLLQDIPMTRWDWTAGKTYTVSEASKKILGVLKAPAQIKFYVSPPDSMPSLLKTLQRDITDKLEELRIVSDGKLKYKIVHVEAGPEGDEDMKQMLSRSGIMPFQVESVQKDEVGIKLIYSTMVIEYKEKTPELIPRVVPQTLQDLEYQLLSRIYKLTFDDKPKVAMFAPLRGDALAPELDKIMGASPEANAKNYFDDFGTAAALVRNNGYDISRIALTEQDLIPESARMLLILNPGTLSERQRYEINRYLVRGGTVVVGAQGFDYTYRREETGVVGIPSKLDLSINRLLEKWGVKINEEILLDENSQVISLSTGQSLGPFAFQMPVKLLNQINVDIASFNTQAPLTRRLSSIGYLWGSALDLLDPILTKNNLKSTVLFTSSPKSWKITGDGSAPLTPLSMKPPADGVKGKYPLAVILEGQFPDAFDGQVPSWKPSESAEKKAIENLKPGRLIVVGCAKSFGEDLIQNPGNLNFYANLIDGYVLDENLLAIRSKYSDMRDIRRLTNAEKVWYRFWTVLLVPLLLVLLCGIRFFLRKKEKQLYLSMFRSRQEAHEI